MFGIKFSFKTFLNAFQTLDSMQSSFSNYIILKISKDRREFVNQTDNLNAIHVFHVCHQNGWIFGKVAKGGGGVKGRFEFFRKIHPFWWYVPLIDACHWTLFDSEFLCNLSEPCLQCLQLWIIFMLDWWSKHLLLLHISMLFSRRIALANNGHFTASVSIHCYVWSVLPPHWQVVIVLLETIYNNQCRGRRRRR